MRAGELVDLFRADVVDTQAPYLWSDPEVYEYVNDAYTMMVRQMGGILDGTSAVTLIPIVAGDRDAAIDRKILRIRQATRVSDGREIKVVNSEDMARLVDEDYGLLRRINDVTTSGPVQYVITGIQEGLVRWVHVPEVDDSVRLLVERLPLERITRPNQEFTDLGEEHHYHLLSWVRHLAYRKPDADMFDQVRSDREREEFLAYCAQAKLEKERRNHKVRTTGYGGI